MSARAALDAIGLATRSELRRRWRSYVVLGALFGVSAGLAVAGFAGADRSERAVADWMETADFWDMAFVPNDPAFGADQHRIVAGVEGIERAEPFSIVFVDVLVDGVAEPGLWPGLAPTPEDGLPVRNSGTPLAAGRSSDPLATDEVVIDENARDSYGLDLGSTIVLRPAPGTVDDPVAAATDIPLRVVGIERAPERVPGGSWTPSAAFMAAHPELQRITNLALWLEPGVDAYGVAQRASAALGSAEIPYIDEAASNRQLRDTTEFEATASRLWAFAVAMAGLSFVGQALVRTVVFAGTDLAVLRELGMSRRTLVLAAAAPAGVSALTALLVAMTVALVASTRFPIGLARGYAFDLGAQVGPVALAAGLAITAAIVGGLALIGGLQAQRRRAGRSARPSRMAAAALRAPLPVSIRIGLRQAVEPGRGRRAVPIRSALVGVTVGVAGVIGAFTFRGGLEDLLAHPARAGSISDLAVNPVDEASTQALLADRTSGDWPLSFLSEDPSVAAAVIATWHRDLEIDGVNVSTWTFDPVAGSIQPTVLRGRVPSADDEIGLAPQTIDLLGVDVGDQLSIGPGGAPVRVVGELLLPEESHQGYASGGYMTERGFAAVDPDGPGPETTVGGFVGMYVRWSPNATEADQAAIESRLGDLGFATSPTAIPFVFVRLHGARFLLLELAVFLALLGLASLTHALVLTVRRRRRELAVLAALGLPNRALVGVVVGQASALSVGALVTGVPLGVVLGRELWRFVLATYTFQYVAPAFIALSVLVAAGTFATANTTAIAPGWMARRIRIAATLAAE